MHDLSVTPSTLEQFQSSIVECFGTVSKGARSPFKFTRAPKSVQLSLIPHSKVDVKLEMKDQYVLIQVKDRRLTMNLEGFLVTTAVQGQTLCLNIKKDPRPLHRLLYTAWRGVAETKHPVFVSRLLRFVRDLEEDLPNTRIDEASAARTDFEVILDALNASPKIGELVAEDPFAAAKLRGLKRKQQMLEQAGGTFSSEEVAKAIGISRQAVDKRRLSNQLLALTQGKRGYGYPRFQFEDGKTLKGLEEVLSQLKTLDPWMQLIFFATPNERLRGTTPIEALRQGDSELVIEAARGYGEQGAA
jgi:hypothetical protein